MNAFDEMFGRSSNPRRAYESYFKWLETENIRDLQKKIKRQRLFLGELELLSTCMEILSKTKD